MSKIEVILSQRVLHFRQPAGTSRGTYTTRHIWLIRLSDGERVGWGECAPLPDLSCDALPHDQYEHTLRQMCQKLVATGQIPYADLRPYPSMLFGLETAFASMRGEAPFDDATPFARGEAGIPINGLVWMGTFEEMYQRLQEKLQAGFHCVKLKIGAIDWQRETELLHFIRQHFSPEQIELRVDANGGFSPTDALEKLRQLALYDIHSIEQPIRQHQWTEIAYLCRHTPVPIALDEELIGVNNLYDKVRLLDTIHPHYIILKPSLHGGMAGCREWIALARERGIGSWITSALESNVGLNAIALFAAQQYQDLTPMPCQGLGTGQLFTDNIPMPIEIRGEQLWRKNRSNNAS